MNTADRRAEIINILLVRRRITAKELADEFHVTVRTIQNDIQALSLGFPIYTKQGGDCVFRLTGTACTLQRAGCPLQTGSFLSYTGLRMFLPFSSRRNAL